MVFPSHGDILKLSQVAWRLGRAFTVDQTNAPIEFKGVEVKLSALARALKELAEVLHTDTCIRFVEEAAKNIHHGIRLIIESCERSIHDLDSLVDHNQIIKKHRTVGGFAIERTWSDLVFMEYDSMIWTSEGGDLRSLQHLLDVHTSSIVLLVHALQRYSAFLISSSTAANHRQWLFIVSRQNRQSYGGPSSEYLRFRQLRSSAGRSARYFGTSSTERA